MFLPHPRVKVSIVGSLHDQEVACSTSDRQGSNFESCVWRTVSSQSSHHPQEVLLAQFSLYVHKGGLKPDSFHFFVSPELSSLSPTLAFKCVYPTHSHRYVYTKDPVLWEVACSTSNTPVIVFRIPCLEGSDLSSRCYLCPGKPLYAHLKRYYFTLHTMARSFTKESRLF